MVMLNGFVAVCAVQLVSFTCTVKVNVPCADGVPLICPFDGSRLKPGGRTPELIDHM
jgi:hypothetical protein